MRVLQNTPATISESWYQGGTLSDPGTVTVTVVRDDGTTVTSGNASGTGAAARTFNLSAAQTASLDVYTVTWTSASLGALVSTVEVVGGFYFTTSDLKALVPNTATDDQIAQARTKVEQAIERRVGFSFVPRYARATLNGQGLTMLRLNPYLRRVRWASTTTAGTTTQLSASDLANLSVSQAGFVTGYYWPTGYGNVTVGYEHGLNGPDEEIRSAALDWARFGLTQDQSIDSRAERLITDDGTLVFSAGMTGLPSVDRVLDSYRLPAIA